MTDNKNEYGDEEPSAQMLKCVTVLTCIPGRAHDPQTGPPIAILTLAHKDEIEEPMMIQIDDVKKLTVDLLRILATFGSDVAKEIIMNYFVERDEFNGFDDYDDEDYGDEEDIDDMDD